MAKLPRSNDKGRSSFQLLQLFKKSGSIPLVYYVFDLLFLEGEDLRKQPLSARRKLLAQVLNNPLENIRLSDELRRTKDELLRVAQEFGLEALVAKKPNSIYDSGRRSGAWVKVKLTRSQEFVIGAYTMPEGARKYFGSLLVGYNTPDGLRFCWPGRDRIFRETPGEHQRATPEDQASDLSVYQPPGENQKPLGAGDYSGGDEALPVGRAGPGRPGSLSGRSMISCASRCSSGCGVTQKVRE
jgi:ATP dependent DNA ligase domain